ncbi:hypothetical protein SAMN05216516_11327 [Izhakiella capsodis]|uniref:Uncharacterized protein n=1 Tax=Izhakiella capsodis TaxID=1367852 RepID=A0A1I5AU66_9GAMM|nr:hypothetical protein [Izhakiella capsodis]SFN65961.1 hypothetical protein SAMN05216516_11327 [Izhakiella capsodis]
MILEKEAGSRKFEVIDRISDKELSQSMYLDNTWCLPGVFGRRLLVNPGVECAGSPSFSDETVVYRYNVLLDGEAKAKNFDVKIKGLGGMDTGHRLHVKKKY